MINCNVVKTHVHDHHAFIHSKLYTFKNWIANWYTYAPHFLQLFLYFIPYCPRTQTNRAAQRLGKTLSILFWKKRGGSSGYSTESLSGEHSGKRIYEECHAPCALFKAYFVDFEKEYAQCRWCKTPAFNTLSVVVKSRLSG